LSLLAVTATAALVLARGYHLGVAATVVALLGGIPALYLTWATYRDDRAEAEAGLGKPDLGGVADELATAVRAQWAQEAAARRLNDPHLPLRWAATDPPMAEDWPSVIALAAGGAGWPAPPADGTWATDMAQLASAEGISEILSRIPTGRLVVLGEAGAGKTMLLIRLVLDLLARRRPGDPVPLLFSLASWRPVDEDLRGWLAGQMIVDHPALGAPAPAGTVGGSQAGVPLEHRLILPVLDGLDELPEARWGLAIAWISEALYPGEAVVVSGRTAAYKAAACPLQGTPARVRGAAVLELRPVDAATAGKYLLNATADRDQWEPVLRALGTSAPVGRVLTTPLMLALAREIYNPVPGHHTGGVREPAELLSPAIGSPEMGEEHLLDAFIPAAYRTPSGRPAYYRGSWTAARAEPWLMFLARHLEYTMASTSLAWWQLEQAIPKAVNKVAGTAAAVLGLALMFAATAGSSASVAARLGAALAVGLTAGLAILGIGRHPQNPMTGVGWSLGRIARLVRRPQAGQRRRRPGQFIALAWLTFPVGMILTALVFGLAAEPLWLAVGLAALGIHGVYGELSLVATPRALLSRERRNYLLLGTIASLYGTVAGLVLGTACGRAARGLFGITDGPSLGARGGIAFAIAFILGVGITGTAWSRGRVSSLLLAMRGRLPWRLMTFLDDAHRHGVLRQAGAVYQFRHYELQRRLATRNLKDQDAHPKFPG
jgi:NACHT domain